MRTLFHLAVIPVALTVAAIAFIAFAVGMTAEWVRDASTVGAPVPVSATQRTRRLRRRI